MQRSLLSLLAAGIAIAPALATVQLPNYISDNMIVQQQSTLTVQGKAAPGSKVKVQAGWADKEQSVKAAADGSFTVKLPTPAAGGPYSLTFEDKDGPVTLENVLAGEVWLCSGQSNMEMPVQGWTTIMDYDNVIATAHHPDIRLLQVKKTTAIVPQEDVEVNGGGWQICTSASMANFSAIAYLFARELADKLGVPVGVIDTTWGGTPAEAWTSAEALGKVPGFENELAALKKADGDRQVLADFYNTALEQWRNKVCGTEPVFDKSSLQEGADWNDIKVPGMVEQNGLPGFNGILWMQRAIEIPADKAGKDLCLNFAAIDDEDVTYFNGTEVARGWGYNTPRHYTVPGKLVKPGINVITVKVTDFEGEGGFAEGATEAVVDGTAIPLNGTWKYLIQSDFTKHTAKPAAPWGSSYPSVLYNAMLEPLKNMPVKGVLWYQGCANVGRAEQYEPLFQALINNWRQLWGPELPFYFVQLAGWLQHQPVQPDSQWAALRNAQAKALCLDNTAMAVAADLGNPADIHPKNKQEVAHRLALIALNRNYGDSCQYEAPRCIEATTEGKALRLRFDKPIHGTTKALTGFIIAGKDGKFTTATPRQTDEYTLLVSAPAVKAPVAVRYGWADYPAGNLYGNTGLPVAPFATDK